MSTKKITIGYITARHHPQFEWFFDSLAMRGIQEGGFQVEVLVCDLFAQPFDNWTTEDVQKRGEAFKIAADKFLYDTKGMRNSVAWFPPKPNIWNGPHRLPKDNWWAASNQRNTWICKATGDWIWGLDDRSVLMPGFMDAVRSAMAGHYMVCGAYEKRTGLTVENGIIRNAGIVTGTDVRKQTGGPQNCGGEWAYGCAFVLPLDWALQVNGFSELCDSTSAEDTIFGLMLRNNGHPMKYDPRLKIVEDRTPDVIAPIMKREDKGVSPNDKSHAILNRLADKKRAEHWWDFDLRQLRIDILSGKSWPMPPQIEFKDWYDGQLVKEF